MEKSSFFRNSSSCTKCHQPNTSMVSLCTPPLFYQKLLVIISDRRSWMSNHGGVTMKRKMNYTLELIIGFFLSIVLEISSRTNILQKKEIPKQQGIVNKTWRRGEDKGGYCLKSLQHVSSHLFESPT